MRHPFIFYPILFFLLFSFSVTGQELLEKTITVDGTEREYLLYVPAAYDGSEDWPLVFNLHGGNSSAQEQSFFSGMNAVADTAHFLVAYPEGLPISGGNFTGWNEPLSPNLPDDVQFIDVLIDTIASEYQVNLARVYSAGMSNGGGMSFTLACTLPGRLAAIASVAAPGVLMDCNPGRPIPILYMHGTADPVIPENGIPGVLPPFVEGVKGWAAASACDTIPEETLLPDLDPTDSSTVSLFTYSGCAANSEVLYYRIVGGGRTWRAGRPIPNSGPVNRDIDADVEIWNFFNRYTLTSAKAHLKPSAINLRAYPNPAAAQLTFEFVPEAARVQLTLYNPLGQPVQVLANENLPAGRQRISWQRPASVAAGLYYYRLQVGGRFVARPVVLR